MRSVNRRTQPYLFALCATLCAFFEGRYAPPAEAFAPNALQTRAPDPGIQAFKDVCLASAPSFALAFVFAKKYGVKPDLSVGETRMGLNGDQSLSIQVNPGKECKCAITTPNRAGDQVNLEFARAVALATHAPFSGSDSAATVGLTPFVGPFRGSKFIFKHDRTGGEAYVMLCKE
jgi:hypothetical protein